MRKVAKRDLMRIAAKYRRVGATKREALKIAWGELRQRGLVNPSKVWHEKRYKQLLIPARDYTTPLASTYYKAQLAEEDHALYQYRKKNPIKKFPLLGLGLIVGIGYLIWRANK